MSMVTEPSPSRPRRRARTPRRVRARWWTDVKSGELGSLPIIVGLIIIAIVFQSQNDRFLTAGNFVNLIVQSRRTRSIAMGVVSRCCWARSTCRSASSRRRGVLSRCLLARRQRAADRRASPRARRRPRDRHASTG
jgi:hypothetical protein